MAATADMEACGEKVAMEELATMESAAMERIKGKAPVEKVGQLRNILRLSVKTKEEEEEEEEEAAAANRCRAKGRMNYPYIVTYRARRKTSKEDGPTAGAPIN